jgi:hypothetical protein
MRGVPYGVTSPESEGLNYLAVEISYGSQWVDLNDGVKFKVGADQTRDSTSKTWRRITAQSPVLGGSYLVHAVPDMVSEQVSLWVYGQDQTDLADNYWYAMDLFEQMSYRMRWTTNEYREYWNCQLADSQSSRAQVWTHSQMALLTFSVDRFADVSRERVG